MLFEDWDQILSSEPNPQEPSELFFCQLEKLCFYYILHSELITEQGDGPMQGEAKGSPSSQRNQEMSGDPKSALCVAKTGQVLVLLNSV